MIEFWGGLCQVSCSLRNCGFCASLSKERVNGFGVVLESMFEFGKEGRTSLGHKTMRIESLICMEH